MKIEFSLFAAGGGGDLNELDCQPLSWGLSPTRSRTLAPTLGRSPRHSWGKTLIAAFAIHFAAIVCICALVDTDKAPSFWSGPVVVVQLTSLAPVAAVGKPEILAQISAPTEPARTEPAPQRAKKEPLQPRPTKLATKAPSKPSTERSIHKTPSTTPAPAASVPTIAAASASEPLSVSAISIAHQGAIASPGTRAAANATIAVTLQPKPIIRPRPAYPALAQRRGLEGKVILQVTVGADGAVRAVTVSRSSSHSLLDEAAVAGVWDWRFQPGRMGGEAKEMTISLPIDFRLR